MQQALLATSGCGRARSHFGRRRRTAPAPTPEHTFTGKIALATDYRFRGISQTSATFRVPRSRAASTTRTRRPLPRQLELERDAATSTRRRGHRDGHLRRLKGEFGDFGLDVGTTTTRTRAPVRYADRQHDHQQREAYVGGSWKWFSPSTPTRFTDYFGLAQHGRHRAATRKRVARPGRRRQYEGHAYLRAPRPRDRTKLTLGASAGTWVKHYNDLSYFDYKIGLT